MNKMLDWLKFFPFVSTSRMFARPDIQEIRGPYFATPRENRWRIGDSTFYFKAPWTNPILGLGGLGGYGRTVTSISPGGRNILRSDWERVFGSAEKSPRVKGQWWFYAKDWYFVGPWFTGWEGCLKASALLIDTRQDAQSNLFHPRVFESTVCDYLDHGYGYRRSDKKPDYRGPLNWYVKSLSSSIQAVVCDLHEIHNRGINHPDVTRFVYFPVSTHQFVLISFDFVGLDTHDEIRAKPLFALCDSIIDSMRLEVGQSTQAEWDKVKETCPDMSLSDTMGEFKWPLFEEEANSEPTEKEILQADDTKKIPSQS
jgi:hypothetical protein